MSDDQALRFYADHAKRYAGRDQGGVGPQLTSFVVALQPGSAILELGTGSGRDAEYMLAAGLDVTPSDGSPDLASQAEQRLGRPVKILRFNELDDDGIYDGVWASASLLHAPASELPDDLARIHRALKPGGLFVASFKAGQGEGRDTFGRYYNYPTAEALSACYDSAAPWADLRLTQTMGSGYDNLPTQWLWMTARK